MAIMPANTNPFNCGGLLARLSALAILPACFHAWNAISMSQRWL